MDKADWFAGNKDAIDLYERLVFIAHTWDDLIDKDRQVEERTLNTLITNLLLHLPTNPFYLKYEGEMRALILCSATSYMAANLMERSGDGHKIELAHYLRYAVAQVGVFMISVLHGIDKAPEIIAEAMPQMIPERLADYIKEHTTC